MKECEAVFCSDDALGYRRSLTPLLDGMALRLDASYRLAHLPLVNPNHSDAIKSIGGKDYENGRHRRLYSLVLPVPHEALQESPFYQEVQTALRTSPLAEKLSWDILPLRQTKLHATLCGGLGEGEEKPKLPPSFLDALNTTEPFEIELRGLLSGNINIGRFYLKAYPEIRNGNNCIQAMQRALGCKETDLYLVGLHNLKDHLSSQETRWLMEFIRAWWDRPILRFKVQELWLLSSKDDLVLDSRIDEKLSLTGFDLQAG